MARSTHTTAKKTRDQRSAGKRSRRKPATTTGSRKSTSERRPLRRDLLLATEGRGLCVHARDLGGYRPGDVELAPWRGVAKAALLPIRIEIKYGVVVRVVVGELSRQEDEEWIDRLRWRLDLPTGELVLQGGGFSSYRLERLETGGPRRHDLDLHLLQVTPGNYDVDLLTFVGSGGIGHEVLHAPAPAEPGARPRRRPPPDLALEGAWFRRTRPRATMPDWLRFRLANSPERDPGHEEEWRAFRQTSEYDALYRHLTGLGTEPPAPLVDLLVHLRPRRASRPRPELLGTGYRPGQNRRWPERFPVGLRARL